MKYRLFLIPLFTGLLLYGCGDSADPEESEGYVGPAEETGETGETGSSEGSDVFSGDGGVEKYMFGKRNRPNIPRASSLNISRTSLAAGMSARGT